MIVRVVAGLLRSLAQFSTHGEWNGRSSQWCDPRARSGTAGVHVLLPAEIDSAYAMSTSKYDGVVFEMEHNPWDGKALRDCLQYMLNRAQIVKAGIARARRDADGAHPGERRRESAVAGEAGARSRLLRHRVAAYLDGRRGLQRGRGLPLSAAEDREELRTGRHPRRRPGRRGALLGPGAAGILREGRRVAARPERRDFRASCRSRTCAASTISTRC